MEQREVKEGQQAQSPNEVIVYTLTTTAWASDPSAASVAVLDVEDSYSDVTSTVTSGSASISGDVITLPTIQSLTRGCEYLVLVRFAAGSNTYEAKIPILCER